MKKLLNLLFIIVFALLIPTGAANAQVPTLTPEEVQKLIEEALEKEQTEIEPLTEEALTKAVLDMKDAQINELEGDISKVIDTFGLYLAIAGLLITVVTIIAAWIMKKMIDDKLTKMGEKEDNIKKSEQSINSTFNTIIEHVEKINNFYAEAKTIKEKLEHVEGHLAERKQDYKDLQEYVGIIEDMSDSSAISLELLREKVIATQMIKETKDVIQRPQKHPEAVIYKLSQKLVTDDKIRTWEDINKHLEVLAAELEKEEEHFWGLLKEKRVETQFKYHDKDSTSLSEELQSNFEEWKYILKEIIKIKETCEAHLKMNPIK